jgi:Holliday junction resolvase-like predicted endonuclease
MNKAPLPILISKASGERVPFSRDKLFQSLKRSGADADSIQKVLMDMDKYVQPEMTTRQIFRHAFSLLKKSSKVSAARYMLKQALMELGPSGYPFEQYVSDLLKSQGYSADVGVIVKGHCVNHEIDVIATNQHEQFMVECKFHNRAGIKCDVKIPLYIQSRFQDVSHYASNSYHFTKGWIFTNTKFSQDAIQYAACMGLQMTGWDYPVNNGLREWIDRSGLHPITCLTTLTKEEKIKLLEQKILHCKDIIDNKELLIRLGFSAQRMHQLVTEAGSLLHNVEMK